MFNKISSYPKWTTEEQEILIANYGKIKYKEISKILNRTPRAIQGRTHVLKIQDREKTRKFLGGKRIYNLNDDFFEIPNLLNCYWAGFLAADGYISKNYHYVVLGIDEKDNNHLEKFKEQINFTGEVKHKNHNVCSLLFSSQKLANDLKNNFNIVTKKSLVLEPPNLENQENKFSFIIGYIDGDGSILKRKENGILGFSVHGTINMNKWILSELQKIVYIQRKAYIGDPNKNHSKLTCISKKAEKILKYLSSFDVPKLERKWRKVYDKSIS